MRVVETIEVFTRRALNEFAGSFGVRPRITDETWDTLIYVAEVESDVGGGLRCLYRDRLTPELARRRWKRTFAIVLTHGTGAARCLHVCEVMIGLGAKTEAEAERQALLVGAAQVELEFRETCGAMVRDLVPYAISHLASWDYPPALCHQK